MFMMILGLIGAGFCVFAYLLIIAEKIDSKGIIYSIMNGVGGVMLLISIAADFDLGDTGGLVVEACWILISIYGIVRFYKRRRKMVGSVG